MNIYKSWMGQSVILQVALGDIKVPLRGMLIKEGSETIKLRIDEIYDIDIYKSMILDVEEDRFSLVPA